MLETELKENTAAVNRLSLAITRLTTLLGASPVVTPEQAADLAAAFGETPIPVETETPPVTPAPAKRTRAPKAPAEPAAPAASTRNENEQRLDAKLDAIQKKEAEDAGEPAGFTPEQIEAQEVDLRFDIREQHQLRAAKDPEFKHTFRDWIKELNDGIAITIDKLPVAILEELRAKFNEEPELV